MSDQGRELSDIPTKSGTEKRGGETNFEKEGIGQGAGALKRAGWNPLTNYDNLDKLAKYVILL